MQPDFLPPPVSGQPVPHGWFARLYQFLLSLIPRGDGNILVDHGPEGVRIKLNPKLLATPQGGGPPGSGGAQELSVTVSGNTASVGITGGTSTVDFVGTGSVTFTENASGQVEVNTSNGGIPFSGVAKTSIRLDTGYHVYAHDGWARMTCEIGSYGAAAMDAGRAFLRVIQAGTTTDHLVIENGIDSIEARIGGSLMIPVVSGSTVQAYMDISANYVVSYSTLPNEILIYD